MSCLQFSSLQSLSRVWLFAVPWPEARQAFLSITNSWGLLRFMSIESVISSNHPLSSPSPLAFHLSQHQGLFQWVSSLPQLGQSIGISASASVLPMNVQNWFPLGWTGLISLLSKGISRIFSNITVQKYQFFSTQPSWWSNSRICTWLLEKPKLWLYRLLHAK